MKAEEKNDINYVVKGNALKRMSTNNKKESWNQIFGRKLIELHEKWKKL